MHGRNYGVLRQYVAAISAALSVFVVGNWLAWPSSAVKHILTGETQLVIGADQVSWAVALLDVGNVISPIPSSFVSDWLGRKRTLIIVSFLLFSSWLLVIFGTNEFYLYSARTLVGVSKGFAFTVVPIYLGEIASTSIRGSVGTIFSMMANFGILTTLCIGPLVNYETLNIIFSPIPVIFFLSFFTLPESPYYLLMKDRTAEARKSLAWFRDVKLNSPSLEQELKQVAASVEEDMAQRGSFVNLVSSPGARRALLISLGFALLQRLSGITSIIAYSTVTLPPTGGYFSPEVYMIIFGVMMTVGPSICGLMVDKLGRKPLMIISCIGCALSTGICAVFYWLKESNDLNGYNWVPYSCIIVYGIIFPIGLGTIPSIVVVELFSSDVRSYAASIAAIFYAVGSFVLNKIYLHVQLTIGVHYMFMFFTISSIICMLFTCGVFFETSGRTFAEIQSILKKENLNDLDNRTCKDKV